MSAPIRAPQLPTVPIGIAEWTTAITTDSPDELTSAPPRIEDVEVTAAIRDRLINVAGRITRSAAASHSGYRRTGHGPTKFRNSSQPASARRNGPDRLTNDPPGQEELTDRPDQPVINHAHDRKRQHKISRGCGRRHGSASVSGPSPAWRRRRRA